MIFVYFPIQDGLIFDFSNFSQYKNIINRDNKTKTRHWKPGFNK
ncbi:hypothetical protein KIS1582_0166 [Cytobacillus firmus]|uniref:Uncharacterized protein n=1 Tax=Cytobacillus firmus TaxID=1399 RepID=A0A800NGH2_CYTFI|nr:hypothetical protein KIS1582_0166 [Cytobacillus firmus]